jgi:hypothetical protein
LGKGKTSFHEKSRTSASISPLPQTPTLFKKSGVFLKQNQQPAGDYLPISENIAKSKKTLLISGDFQSVPAAVRELRIKEIRSGFFYPFFSGKYKSLLKHRSKTALDGIICIKSSLFLCFSLTKR